MIKKRILAMITVLVFAITTFCTPMSFAWSTSFASISTNPNATDPNATDPDATDPNATDPNAGEEEEDALVVVEVKYYVDGEEMVDTIHYRNDTLGEVMLPYRYDRDKGIDVIAYHHDGSESTLDIYWESDTWGEVNFISEIAGEEIEYRLVIYVDEPSSNAECELYMVGYNKYDEPWDVSIDSEAALSEDGVVATIPYGHDERVELYVELYDRYATLEGFYAAGEESQSYSLVSDGVTKSFKVIAENGNVKNYKVVVVASDGTSTDVEVSANFRDLNLSDSDTFGTYREIKIPLEKDQSGNKYADVTLPYMYDDGQGVELQFERADCFSTDLEGGENINLGADGKETVKFNVTSPNGENTAQYTINFTRESAEDAKKAELKTFVAEYVDLNGDKVTVNIDPSDASDADGAVVTIPAEIMKAYKDEYYVNVYAAAGGYGYIASVNNDVSNYYGNHERDYIDYNLDISWQSTGTVIFDVISSDGQNTVPYKIKLINGDKANKAQIDEVSIEYTRVNEEEISESYIWLDEDTNKGDIELYPFDSSKPIVLKGRGADGTPIYELVEFEEGKNEAIVTFTSKSPDGKNEITYTVTVYKREHPIANVAYSRGEYDYEEECYFDEYCQSIVRLPYDHTNLSLDVMLLDGTKINPEIVWENDVREDEHDSLIGKAQFATNGKTYTIDFIAAGISSETGATMELQAWNGKTNDAGERAYIYIEVDEDAAATEEGYTVVVPYGCADYSKFYIYAASDYATVEGGEAGESYETDVAVGETRTFNVTAQDGTTQDYKINFVESKGDATELRADICFEWTFMDEEEADRYIYKNLDFENENGVMTAYAEIPYFYDEETGITFIEHSDEYVSISPGLDTRIYPDLDKPFSYEFTVTSPNGNNKQKYAIILERESAEQAAEAGVDYIEVSYVDTDGDRSVETVDMTEEADGDVSIYIPEDIDFNEYVEMWVYAKNYASITNSLHDMIGMGDMGWFMVAFMIKKDSPQTLSFEVTSSDRKNAKDYNVTIISGEKPHECVWDDGTVTIEPTCTEEGEMTYNCEGCDATKTETILPKGHNMTHNPGYAPTCTETGRHEHWYCVDCHRYYADEYGNLQHGEPPYIDPTGHDYETVVTAPTCTAIGYTTYTCTVCGDNYIADEVDPTGHDYEAVVTKPTCTKAGYTTYTCAVCGDTYKGDNKDAIEHTSVTDKAVAATYFKTGLTEGSHCKVCNEVLVKQKTVAKKKYTAVPKTVTANLSTASKGYDNVKISWSKVSGASGYKVYYKKASAKKWLTLKSVSSKTTSYTTKNLATGTKYTFKVVPYVKSKSGKTVVYSTKYKTASAVTLKKISTPKVVKSGSKVKVSWKNIAGESGYQISQSTKRSGTKIVATYKTTKGKSKVIKAKKGKKYYYKVRAFKYVKVGKKTYKVYGPWSKVKDYKRR